ncbi:FAD-binding and (Fe-S)-binding domain-containing protein [Phytohabitans kaempferiae]|uniref:D-lactate dehydrogenase (cytochrome) n=1 Tax=Phytohabitans kaempferiae TaxID=1620943 RepID=A0ABV6MCB9_9ACTN
MTATLAALEELVPHGVRARTIDRFAFAHDASHYLIIPEAVVAPTSAEQVATLLRASHRLGLALTFRSAGTSLSGQASTGGILVDVRRNFRHIEVLDDGARVRVQPGATIRQVNARLLRYGRKLGPDPASEVACTIGGAIANNSSGMACGTAQNVYHTIESAVLVLPSGTILDTGAADADGVLRALEPRLWRGLSSLRDRIRAKAESIETLERLFSIKNTMGYGLNTLVDYDRPVDMLLHLVVGSEGTLAFVAEATLRTVPIRPAVATGFLIFPTLADATAALPALVATDPAVVELLDATSLRVAQRAPVADAKLLALDVERHTALLVEYQEADAETLSARLARAEATMTELGFDTATEFATSAATRAALWHIRKGLYATVAGDRPAGTTALLEDIAVPVANLLPTCHGLVELFDQFDYHGSVIFGHAKDGNLHFMLNENFDPGGTTRRYRAFTEAMVDLVLAQQGTLKAEHGTGRVMAPYVRRQYGDELYEVMQHVKQLFDPHRVLNPGVLLNEDPDAHVTDLKSSPPVEAEVDRCVECGYCEPACPSKDLTLTPRQRIVVRRELARAEEAGDAALARELRRQYRYDGTDTCAADGMCQVACPVHIDTGQLIKRLRGQRRGGLSRTVWNMAARVWGPATRLGSGALTIAKHLPAPIVTRTTALGRALLGPERVPLWQADLPRGGRPRRPRPADDPAAVYLPACIGSIFGPALGGVGVQEAVLALSQRGGVRLRIPDGVAGLCCGTPWSSKGHTAGYETMRRRVVGRLWRATDGGRLPVVCDAASCTDGFIGMLASVDARIRVVDAVTFVDEQVLPRIRVERPISRLVLHPTCSSARLGIDGAAARVAAAVAKQVDVPVDSGCCAFAGDRGLLHPALTASATSREAAEVVAAGYQAHASVNRTCEIALTRATGQPYRHILELLEAASRSA